MKSKLFRIRDKICPLCGGSSIRTPLSFPCPQHDIGAEDAVPMGEPAVPAVLVRNAADGLEADALAPVLGGLEYTVLFPDFSVKGIFHCQQYHMPGMQVCLRFDLPSCRDGPQAGFQSIFQKVGQHRTKVNLRYRKLTGQVEFKRKRDALLTAQEPVMACDTVHGCIVTQIQPSIRDAVLYIRKIFFQAFPFFLSGKILQGMEVMAHIMACLAGFRNGGAQAVVLCLLHGEELVLLPELVIPVQALRHEIEHGIEKQEQEEQRKADDDISLHHAAQVQKFWMDGDHEQVQTDEQKWQDPKYIPSTGKGVVLQQLPRRMGGRVPGNAGKGPAKQVVEQSAAEGKPGGGIPRGKDQIQCFCYAAQAGKDAAHGQKDADRFPPCHAQCMDIDKSHYGNNGEEQLYGLDRKKTAQAAACKRKQDDKWDSCCRKFDWAHPQVLLHGQAG